MIILYFYPCYPARYDDDYIHIYIFNVPFYFFYLSIICLQTVIRYKVFLLNGKHLNTDVWFQVINDDNNPK